MFVPRAVRLKGVKETRKPKLSKPLAKAKPSQDEANNKDALVEAMGETSMNSPAPQQDTNDAPARTRGPRFVTRPVTTEYIAQLAAGIELIFTDYAHHEEERAKWLMDHYRTVDHEENYIHLTAILEHPYISKLKPEATHVLLQQALHDHPSNVLELSSNAYYVRRRPLTYPLPFVPNNSFAVVDDDGLSFWDQRTIYVEPHLRNLCPTPARVAQWLTEHGQLKPKWLPVQAVHTLWNSCAFVVLSGNVIHKGTWVKWREAGKPADWKIMTKLEHTKRTAEYLALLKKENPRGMSKVREDTSQLPPIARPAALAMNFEPLPEQVSVKSDGKKKRKRRKPAKSSDHTRHESEEVQGQVNEEEEDKLDAGVADAPEVQLHAAETTTNKKKRKRRKSGKANNSVDNVTADAVATADGDEPRKRRR